MRISTTTYALLLLLMVSCNQPNKTIKNKATPLIEA